MDIASDIKSILEFYQALGFERLPIKIGAKAIGQGKNEKCGMRNVELKNKTEGKKQDEGKRSEVRSQNSVIGSRKTEHAEKKREIRNTKYEIRENKLPTPRLKISELKAAALEGLREDIEDCHRCRLSKGRKNIVFGEGSPDAAIMFIGEAPGAEEDIQARPFVGAAGELLTRLIKKMGFKREDVYIGNIVKCRPPANRDPEEDEIMACLPFIEKQIEVIMPKAIMALGRIASHTLTGVKTPITKLRGNFCEYKGIPLMPTYHPAYLLRNPDMQERWRMWNDAEKVLEKLKGGEA